MTSRLAAIISIDLRSLAVLRIGLGVLILADLMIRGGDLGVWMAMRVSSPEKPSLIG
jgi:hypothetical protein